ncbi:2-hydroxyacid dehydrogenase [Lutibaculum baratangense]|uniref:D-3-phosphoglycerate dehydrogenase n=1 Tax=Lutibaculum baratangense AMV1 TaxID=631454 RepID=V4R0M9_9HYPH|nr:glyoxylate/hydroxypyruvate reductase A [Lutibaculum baratangense]ESR25547.1 D-3-phosphoglycerate dehydrogenase [Lutibaculum baratangense AMV1]
MSLLLAIEGWDLQEWRDRFRRVAPDLAAVVQTEDYDPGRIRYACAWNAPQGLLGRLENLEILFSLGAGVDHLLRQANLPDVPIVRVVDPSLTERMAEWVVLQVLLHHRRQLDYLQQQRARLWREHSHPMARDVSVGIMGLGELGTRAAQALQGIGYDVAGWSRSPKSLQGVECHHGEGGLGAFLARTDILVSLLPLTPDTEGLVDLELLKGLRRDNRLGGAYFVNAGRGRVQVEADIMQALRDGTIAGASLDVFETEPLPGDSPLWSDPRLVITPHVAAESDPEDIAAYVVRQIRRHQAGEPLQNLVDLERGY